MPIYEFECGSCGDRFQRLLPVGGMVSECPRCGADTVRKRISGFSVRGGAGNRCSGCRATSCDGCSG